MCTWADLTAVIGFHPDLKPLQRHTGVGLRIGVTISGDRSDDFRPSPGWLFSGRALATLHHEHLVARGT